MGEDMTDIDALLRRAEDSARGAFARIDQVEAHNTRKVLRAFRENRVASRDMAGSTGYGYGDVGRETLEHVTAAIFGAEDAIITPHLLSGTHALSVCLMGLLLPGDHLLSACGKPYDTLDQVIGRDTQPGSLGEMGVLYDEVQPADDGGIDVAAVLSALRPETRVIWVQRSRGYAWRNALLPQDMRPLFDAVRRTRPDIYLAVDNCYGTFVTMDEPTDFGADVIVGSLIKNAGGGIAPTGGYMAGTRRAIGRIEHRLTAPGIGREIGSYEAGYRAFFQGLFMAPHTVAQALKTAALAAQVFGSLGMQTTPSVDAPRADIVQAIRMENPERLVAFCRAIQEASPVDSFLTPEAWDMPGYDDKVIMAAGTFVAGASIELTADAPMRPPYIAYLQGALTYAHGKLALGHALNEMVRQGLLEITP